MSQTKKKTRTKNNFGQYFTPVPVTELMVTLSEKPTDAAVLEPCSGQGVFLDTLIRAGYTDIDAVEIDPKLAHHVNVDVANQSFLTFAPGKKYDLVIGNPPYIRWKDLPSVAKEEVQEHKLYGAVFNSLSDYLAVFIVSSVLLLKDGGELIFVTPSYWMHTTHSQALRDWLLQRGSIFDIVHFGESKIFENVSSSILVFRYKLGKFTESINFYSYNETSQNLKDTAFRLANASLFTKQKIPSFRVNSHWTLATKSEVQELESFERACACLQNDLLSTKEVLTLGDVAQIANGMVSGLDRAFKFHKEFLPQITQLEKMALRRVLKAKDIEPYVSYQESFYIDIPHGLTKNEVVRQYPNFFAWLEQYQELLEARYSYRERQPFWEWAFKRSESFFLDPRFKGFVPCKERITNRKEVRFTLADRGVIATQDVTGFAPNTSVGEDIAYIVAFLNHPAVSNWVRKRGLIKGGVAEFSEKPLASIPFRRINFSSEDEATLHGQICEIMYESLAQKQTFHEKQKAQIVKGIDTLLSRGI